MLSLCSTSIYSETTRANIFLDLSIIFYNLDYLKAYEQNNFLINT